MCYWSSDKFCNDKGILNQVAADLLHSTFNEKGKELIASDQAFNFMNSIEGRLAH